MYCDVGIVCDRNVDMEGVMCKECTVSLSAESLEILAKIQFMAANNGEDVSDQEIIEVALEGLLKDIEKAEKDGYQCRLK